MNNFDDYKWIKVKHFKFDSSKSWEENYKDLEKHHIEETTFLINTARKLAKEKMEYLCDKKRHLICIPYSKENLHKMASALGIKRHWFHRTHYDIPKRRLDEIMAKCRIVSSKEIVKIIKSYVDKTRL